MLALVFDTETTGLTNFQLGYDHPVQPDIVQLGCQLVECKGFNTLSQLNIVVIPEKKMDDKARETHGFDDETIQAVGLPRRVAVILFNHLVRRANLLVGHNLDFDFRVMRTAYFRESLDDSELIGKNKFCTMQKSTDICKIPSPKRAGSFKWPSLQEAYKHFVDPAGFGNAHNAAADVNATVQILKALHGRGLLPV